MQRGQDNSTERFLHDNPRAFFRSVDDSGSDEVAFAFGIFTPDRDVPFLFLDVTKEPLDTLILHGVLNGTEENTFICARTELEERLLVLRTREG